MHLVAVYMFPLSFLYNTVSRPQQIRCFASSAPSLHRYTSVRRPFNDIPSNILRRITFHVETGFPRFALHHFRKRVSIWDLHTNRRSRALFEDVLNLFIRKSCFAEVKTLIKIVKSTAFKFPIPMRAKLMTVKLVNDSMHTSLYINNMRTLFTKAKRLDRGLSDTQFCGLLHLLARREKRLNMMERLAELFISIEGNILGPSSIAFLIRCHVIAQSRDSRVSEHGQAIEHWLSYHVKFSPRDGSGANSAFCIPYNALIVSLLQNSRGKDPQTIYGPILERMSNDGAWADTVLLNTLIQAEVRYGNVYEAFVLYGKLRTSASHGIFPDENTFSQLFAASGRQAHRRLLDLEASPANTEADITLSRILFREMLEAHKIANKAALSKYSLSAALWQFVVSGDYAGACVALSTYTRHHVVFGESTFRSVLWALAQRCKVDMKKSKNRPFWAGIFLDNPSLRADRKKRYKVNYIIRHMMIVFKKSTTESAESPVTEQIPADNEIRVNGSLTQQEDKTLRSKRLETIDFLISRALASAFSLDGAEDPIKASEQSVMSAALEMLPSTEHINNSIFKGKDTPNSKCIKLMSI